MSEQLINYVVLGFSPLCCKGKDVNSWKKKQNYHHTVVSGAGIL